MDLLPQRRFSLRMTLQPIERLSWMQHFIFRYSHHTGHAMGLGLYFELARVRSLKSDSSGLPMLIICELRTAIPIWIVMNAVADNPA